jgi:hypothetical protein
LPKARLCLDVAHARQLDTTLSLLREIFRRCADRIAELHISELDSLCQHQPMSQAAVEDYQEFATRVKRKIPVIIESMLGEERRDQRLSEMELAEQALNPTKRVKKRQTFGRTPKRALKK